MLLANLDSAMEVEILVFFLLHMTINEMQKREREREREKANVKSQRGK